MPREGSKVNSLKRRVRSHVRRHEKKNRTRVWREAHIQVKMFKNPQIQTSFGSCKFEKSHTAVARSTFPSQNVENPHVWTTFGSCTFEKSHARVVRSTFPSQNVRKHHMFGPLLEIARLKNRTRLWREAHFQVKMLKNLQRQITFGSCKFEKLHAAVARSTNTCSDHSWKLHV